MALDATVGGESANSYVSLVEADAYFEDRAFATAWVSHDYQAQLLITATSLLEWYVKWKGTKTLDTQALHWPAVGALRKSGASIDGATIPLEVKVAVMELALSSVSEDRTAENPLAGIEQVKVASLLIKADNGDSASTAKKAIPEKIWKILSDFYLNSGLGVVRLMRA